MRLRSTRLTAIANAIRDKFYGAALNMRFDNTTSLDSRITFSRTTNATVTGSNGLIQNAPMNLLTFSEQFDNAYWSKTTGGVASAPVITANAGIAPDGTTTADQVVFNLNGGTTSADISSIAATAQAYNAGVSLTQSVYLKTTDGTSKAFTYVNIDGTTSTITATGVWQRFTATVTPSAGGTSNPLRLRLRGSESTASSASIYMWGAQLELGSTATTYNSTTVKNLLGFTENFDNAAWTKSNAFVQTNLLLQSQNFENSSWAKQASPTVTSDTTNSPDGTLTADTLQNVNGVSSVGILQLVTLQSGVSYTKSIWLRAGTTSTVVLGAFASGFLTASATIESGPGTVSGASLITVSGLSASEWTRVRYTVTGTGVSTSFYVYPETTGSGTGKNIVIWGAQLVQGTSAGDYKATYTAAAAVGYTDIYGQPFAQKLVENTATTFDHYVFNPTLGPFSGKYTYSIYAKVGERQYLQLAGVDAGVPFRPIFDLVNGTVISDGGVTSFITAMGNGWYRCGWTKSCTSLTQVTAILQATATYQSYTGDGTSGIYIFGAQLSDSASVDPYVYQPVAAPTSTAYYGPRFDYDPVTLAPKGLLIEEQRTNLVTYSEQLDNAAWVKINTAITTNTVVAPDGTLTGDKLASSTAVIASHQCYQISVAITNGVSYTWSVYMKQGEYAWGIVNAYSATDSRTYFNLATGTVGTVAAGATATITPVGNGWYRCTVTRTSAAITGGLSIEMTNADNVPSFAAVVGTGIFIWGAQLEAGAFATSYIPTVASQVTRAADSASMIGNNFARWYNQTAGTIYAQTLDCQYNSATAATVVQIDNGVNTGNRYLLYFTGLTTARFYLDPSATGPAAGTVAIASTTKMTGAYDSVNAVSAFNGVAQAQIAYTAPATQTRLTIGAVSGAAYLNGHISRIAYYPRRLANTELQGITS